MSPSAPLNGGSSCSSMYLYSLKQLRVFDMHCQCCWQTPIPHRCCCYSVNSCTLLLVCMQVCVFVCAVQIDKLFTIGVIQPDIVADEKVDLVLEKVSILITLPPIGKRSIVMSVSVCLSVCVCVCVCLCVCDHIFGTTRAIFAKVFVHVTYCRGSVFLWLHSDTLCTMTSYLLICQGCSTSLPS